jgi:hypothetical protein
MIVSGGPGGGVGVRVEGGGAGATVVVEVEVGARVVAAVRVIMMDPTDATWAILLRFRWQW